MQYTDVFTMAQEAFYSDKRFILLQGGSRSSKTYSLCQLIIIYCLTNDKKLVSIVRRTMPSLRGTVMRDFFEILREMGLYNITQHNRSENIYTFPNASQVEFFSCEEEQKIRGRKRHVCWVNEANEIWNEHMLQLNIRTEEKMIFDYNPSFSNSFLIELSERDNAILQKSTFRMNPFLSDAQVEELQFLKNTDPDAYKVYNLGERAQTQEHVIRHHIIQERPVDLTEIIYSIDWGWTHPNALVKIYHDNTGRRFHFEEITGHTNQTIDELIAVMNEEVNPDHIIIADAARPDLINTVNEAGFNCVGADKSVKKGLEILRTSILTIEPSSKKIISNLESYRYKKIRGIITDDVMKVDDDFVDAMRYGCTYLRGNAGGLQFSC